MVCYSNNTLSEYLERLAAREPVPGGGSAAAVSASMGAALLGMSVRYSQGKGKGRSVEARFERIIVEVDKARELFLSVAGTDAQVYLDVVAARKSGNKAELAQANRAAAAVPRDLVKGCRKLLRIIPFLKKEANRYLISDIIVAEVFLNAAVNAAEAMVKANQ